MLAVHLPTSPIESPRGFSSFPAPPAHQQHFSLAPLPLPIHKRPAARPKLSLKITADDKRTFGSKSSGSSSFLKAPLTAGPLSPTTLTTMRNTQFNARRPTSDVPQLSVPEPSYASSTTSSSDESSTTTTAMYDDMHSEMKDKKRKRRFQRDSHQSRDLLIRTSHPVAPSSIPITISLPAPQPSKRATNPSARRVAFVDAPIIIPGASVYVAESYASSDDSSTDDSSDSESESSPVKSVMTIMEQMEEINKLRYKVEAMDVQMAAANPGQEQKDKVGGECSSWMFRLGKLEYDEISKQEAAETSAPEGGVGFGFGAGIKF